MAQKVKVPRRQVVVELGGDLAGGRLVMGVPTPAEFGAIRRGEMEEMGILELMVRYCYESNLDIPLADVDFITSSDVLAKWFEALLEAAVPKTPAAA